MFHCYIFLTRSMHCAFFELISFVLNHRYYSWVYLILYKKFEVVITHKSMSLRSENFVSNGHPFAIFFRKLQSFLNFDLSKNQQVI